MESDSIEIDEQQSVSSIEEPRRDERAVEVAEASSPLPRTAGPDGFLSRHRMIAAINQLQNQINFIQEEIDQLETLGESSIVCQELLSTVESIPDPLLPLTQGPVNTGWDRWFRGTQSSRRRWI